MEMKGKKRSFIPPEFRPYVKGSQLNHRQQTFDFFNRRERRQWIVDLVTKRRRIGNLDEAWVQSVLIGFFPALKKVSQ